MKRTPLSRKTPLKTKTSLRQRRGFKRPSKDGKGPPYRGSKIRQRSKKKIERDKVYSKLRLSFLALRPYCQGCLYEVMRRRLDPRKIQRSTEIQHCALRGRFYLRTDTWAAVCREHGERCTVDNPWAYEAGLRLTKEQIKALP